MMHKGRGIGRDGARGRFSLSRALLIRRLQVGMFSVRGAEMASREQPVSTDAHQRVIPEPRICPEKTRPAPVQLPPLQGLWS
jgi:hypothetical protein